MEFVNRTPFSIAPMPGRLNFPNHSLTFVIKGTFDLVPGEVAAPAEEQLFPTGDQCYDEDDEQTGSLYYDSDFAFRKPAADVLAVGTAHAPGGEPTRSFDVRLQVGDLVRTLTVSGERYWKPGLLSSAPTPAEPFVSLPLRYEEAYGGAGFSKNPTGRGFEREEVEGGEELRPLPRIEDPTGVVTSPRSRPEPAAFGPLHREWAERQSHVGTYKGRYLEQRWPWFPEDFDFAYFQAAPPEQQVAGYLRGDEELRFDNMNAEVERFESRLPGVRVRCFVDAARGDSQNEFREVNLQLDTLWVDTDQAKLVLVWRGWTPVASEEFNEVERVFVAAEPLQENPASTADCEALYQQTLRELEAEFEEEAEPEPVDAEAELEEASTLEAELEAADKERLERLQGLGVDPENPPEPTPEVKAQMAQLLNELGLDAEEAAAEPLTRARVDERAAAGASLAEEDLTPVDLEGATLSGLDLRDVLLTDGNLARADLSGSDLTGAVLAGAKLTGAKLTGSCLDEADFSAADLTGADFTDAKLNGAILDAAQLQGALFDRAEAKDASFAEADMRKVQAVEADFSGADLTEANLAESNYAGTNLTDATLEGAQCQNANFDDADLTGLRAADGCDLTGSTFLRAKANGAIWERSVLTDCDLRYSSHDDGNFEGAQMARANLSAARMRNARLARAQLCEAKFVQADMFEGSFEKADLTGADLRGASLYGVELLDAQVESARFDGADLNGTKLA